MVLCWQGDLGTSRALWIAEDLIAWKADIEDPQFYLHASETANLKVTAKGVEGLSPSHCPTPFMAYETTPIQRINTTIENFHEVFLVVIFRTFDRPYSLPFDLCRGGCCCETRRGTKRSSSQGNYRVYVMFTYFDVLFKTLDALWQQGRSFEEKSWISVLGSDHNTIKVLTFISPSFGRCWKSFPIWQGIIVCGYLQVPMPRNWSSLN